MTNNEIYSVLAKGPFLRKDVTVEWREQAFSYPFDFQEKVEKHWVQIKNPHIFNGELVRLDGLRMLNDQLLLELALSDYATLLYSNAHAKEIVDNWGNLYLSNALGISAIVISSDNKIVLMKRSTSVGEFPNCWDVFGGHIDKPEIGSKPDIYTAMQKELVEELALHETYYELEVLAVIKALVNQKPELIFSAFVKMDFAQIKVNAEKAKDRFEWQTILDVKVNELYGFLARERTNLSPSAFACLEMFLKLNKEAHFGTSK